MRSKSTCFFLTGAVAAASAVWLSGAPTPMNPQTISGLGTTSFETSTRSPGAQTAFMRGLLLLHLFEYSDAAEAFGEAEKLDPAFVMAYWGEAMTFNHGVWNQVDELAGKAALAKFAPTPEARAARTGDAREKSYLTAVELFYDGTGAKVERDRRYAKEMERLSSNYPDDRNAQLFYALALLSQGEGVRDVPVYLHAAQISKAIFRLEPENPGAAHYWIHGMDDPDHAAGALEAARALSKIAPEAPHALHMCSHIFIALGMWDDVVKANVEAIRVGNLHDQAHGFPPYNCGHYANWLEYGYFQQGRLREARESVAACGKTDADTTAWVMAHAGQVPFGAKDSARLHRRLVENAFDMKATEIVEAQDWTSTSPLGTSTSAPEETVWWNFTKGLAAAERNDLVGAHSALSGMQTEVEAMRASGKADPEESQTIAVATRELSGFIQVKSGQVEAGLGELRHAVEAYHAMAFAFGPPVTIKPPEELLGEVLLERKDASGARQFFEDCLRRAPGRTQSLLGLARSEQLAGDEVSALKTYEKLGAIWHAADADAPGVKEASTAVAQETSAKAEASIEANVSYGKAGGEDLKLDIYLPARRGEELRPAVLLIHGGGWTQFDKSTMRGMGQFLARSGIAGFAVDYRLFAGTRNRWPAQLDDVQRAVRWVRANAAKYGVDPERIGAFGHSAGAQLAALLGMEDTRDISDPAGSRFSSRVQAVVDVSGPIDFTVGHDSDGDAFLTSFLGVEYGTHPEIWREASPAFHVANGNAPFLIVHGTEDREVPISQAQELLTKLQTVGVPCSLVKVNDGHTFRSSAARRELAEDTLAFFNRYLAARP